MYANVKGDRGTILFDAAFLDNSKILKTNHIYDNEFYDKPVDNDMKISNIIDYVTYLL